MQKNTINDLFKMIEDGIENVYQSEKWIQHLKTVSRFSFYSLNNIMLISLQKPDATAVAGYKKWKNDFGRNVIKGESAIRILAPIISKKTDDETGEERITPKGFRYVNVFDVSQTEGKELPFFTVDELNAGVDEYTSKINSLIEFCKTNKIRLKFQDIKNGAKGYYSPVEHLIAIKNGMSEAQTIKTLIHELAHAELHCNKGKYQHVDARSKEIQAESIAYIVCHYMNIDTSQYSFEYLASWGKELDKESLRIILETIRFTANKIIKELV